MGVPPRRGLEATWIGHSTVLLRLGGASVLTDPMFSERASPVQWMGPRRVKAPGLAHDALPPLDVVAVSHNHYDHLDRLSVKRIARSQPRATWIVPRGVGACITRWGVEHIVELEWWQATTVGSLRVTATPARHFSGRGVFDRNRSHWCGFAFESEGWRALFTGDTAFHLSFGEIGSRCGPFDLVMMPIGAYDPRWFMGGIHMDPEEAVQAYRDLAAASPGSPGPVMLGIHCGTFRLTHEAIEEPPQRAASRWRALGLDERKLWIPGAGETRVLDHSS